MKSTEIKPDPIERNNTHLAGEYFVAAELYRKGFSVGMTIGNAKAIDMFASIDGIVIPIQVKAIQRRKSVGWPIMKDKILLNVLYIFVNLNVQDAPDYYIATGKETRDKVKQYKTRGIIDLSTLNNDDFLNRWDKLHKELIKL